MDKDRYNIPTETVMPGRETVRVLLCVLVQLQWEPFQWDARTAFLHSGRMRRWNTTVWLVPPKEAYAWGFLSEHEVWLLTRAIYGLNDGPVEWMLEVHLVVVEQGFTLGRCDLTLYLLFVKGRLVGALAVHYDDFLWRGEQPMREKMAVIRSRPSIGSEEETDYAYLGSRLRVVPDPNPVTPGDFGIHLSQAGYIDAIEVH